MFRTSEAQYEASYRSQGAYCRLVHTGLFVDEELRIAGDAFVLHETPCIIGFSYAVARAMRNHVTFILLFEPDVANTLATLFFTTTSLPGLRRSAPRTSCPL